MVTGKIAVFALLFLASALFGEKLLAKRYSSEKKGLLVNYVNRKHKWGEIGLAAVCLATLLAIAVIIYPKLLSIHYFLGALPIVYGFRTYMEWKHRRSEKRYIASGFGAVYMLTMIICYHQLFM
jgi:hypothetical protein